MDGENNGAKRDGIEKMERNQILGPSGDFALAII
jgi:hypothetical protein